ncbi:hypothetical protein [Flagellimonas marinaquae]|uniref:hypothetical protein n=1 Tax=Flagellimonas marinaquae TaxID=254955 RepID=UPI000F8DF955|nr:hypothetical protein [Allomuricauda aquimarina]
MEKSNLKILLLSAFFGIFFIQNTLAQSYNDEKTSLGNFIKRMYKASPFEGVKIVEDYDNKYIISVLSLEKSGKSTSILTRIAQTKAQRQVSTFFNGAVITSEFIIKTTEEKVDSAHVKTTVETIEKIKENSVGFVNGLELLTNFDLENGNRQLLIYIKKIEQEVN